jgi:hypothetical protein
MNAAPGVEDAKRAVKSVSDSELLDSVDELYDRMAEASEQGHDVDEQRYRFYHEIGLAEAIRRGLITQA